MNIEDLAKQTDAVGKQFFTFKEEVETALTLLKERQDEQKAKINEITRAMSNATDSLQNQLSQLKVEPEGKWWEKLHNYINH